MIQDLSKRRLRVSLALAVIFISAWLLQGWQGWRALHAYNDRAPPWRMLPSSAAIEAWFFGVHPSVPMYGKRVQVTLSALQRDLCMDTHLVANCGQVHRLLTACFLHNGIFHLLFNLGYLYTLAQLEAGSPGAFLSTFLLAGIAGNLAFMAAGQGRRGLGASGGICGLIGFELVSLLRQRQQREFKRVMQATFGLLVIGYLLPGVANSAHIGGLLTGFLVAFAVARRSGYRSALVPWWLLVGAIALSPPGRHFLAGLKQAAAIAVTRPGALGHGLRLAF